MEVKIKQKSRIKSEIFSIPPYLIRPGHSLSRTEFSDTSLCALADSIRRYGILQPLCVRLSDDGKYELVCGERRLRAAILLGFPSVPCILLDISQNSAQYISVIENSSRENLSMFEFSRAVKRLMERENYTSEQMAQSLSMSFSELSEILLLTKYTREEMQEISRLGISEKIACLLAHFPRGIRAKSIKLIAESGYSERLVHKLLFEISKCENITEAEIEKLFSRGKEKTEQNEKKERKPRVVLHDLCAFENSLLKNIDILRQANFTATCEKEEKDSETVYTLRVKNRSGN